VRPDRATREKWRIPYWKEWDWSIFIFGACSLCPNVEDENDVMVDIRLLDEVDYFVVMACYLINYYLSYLCMLSIGC
jgi:hypothetical protein